MNNSLKGKVALITGGSTGIGFATAKKLAEEGVKVVIANANAERGKEAVQKLREAGGEATFLQTDVSDVGQIKALVDKTVATYGKLDYAFNNAGVASMKPITSTPQSNANRQGNGITKT